MQEIRTKLGRFKVTNQRLADQMRTKNGLFCDLEILKIHKQIYRQTHQRTPNTVDGTLNTVNPQTLNETLHDNDI